MLFWKAVDTQQRLWDMWHLIEPSDGTLPSAISLKTTPLILYNWNANPPMRLYFALHRRSCFAIKQKTFVDVFVVITVKALDCFQWCFARRKHIEKLKRKVICIVPMQSISCRIGSYAPHPPVIQIAVKSICLRWFAIPPEHKTACCVRRMYSQGENYRCVARTE